ncbi:Por secretion system C-terminal sorting domain-containing protein [Chitinophaga sp. YR627]|uniref:T9SS type A sorting domain-containing protein n=1 Tax=Chitinophaga sp. YR627 TaxID=1881041 RepID=UPI0008E19E9B|nr:T9SS type A sorting domain-containing protein [Chitinophaga sp. YR627]SFO97677.1 Por secretion system C-terminal sorting domain-containing protein [Chitinophaga sp. YR627]
MRKPSAWSLVFTLLLTITLHSNAQVAPAAQSVTGKLMCGYQAWFNCYGDGSPIERWSHWSGGRYRSDTPKPAPGRITFEAYPDVTEYPAANLFQTALGNLNDGRNARLFTSWKQTTIDLHFSWMQQNGIDGVAQQRFLGPTRDGVYKASMDSLVLRIRRSAEKYQRIFYIMYDMNADDTAFFKADWLHIENDLRPQESPYYAHQNGKPVICIWGFGLNERSNQPANSLAIINWLKGKGYYVIGGVPAGWRTGTRDSYAGYENVYKAFNMLSPWAVGRFASIAGADNFKNENLAPDLAYCNANGLDYQPVIFPGFAWSNWNGGTRNQISRAKGEFFWRQLYNIKSLGMNTAYIAMFDEYDEGTVIAKMADSYFAVPNNQYFLTTSADGTYIGADFYLRLAGQATKVLKGTAPLTTNVTIPYSTAPLWFRTSMEAQYDATLSWTDTPDQSVIPTNVTGDNGTGTPICGIVQNEISRTGPSAIRFAGRATSAAANAYCAYKVFDVNIPVTASTGLSFWLHPTNNISRYVTVDLIMTDGTSLRDAGAVDQHGVSMHPGAGHGTVNTWSQVSCNIGRWLSGKTIDRIIVDYVHGNEIGNFKTYIDDIIISDTTAAAFGAKTAAAPKTAANEAGFSIYPQPANNHITLQFDKEWQGKTSLSILNTAGHLVEQKPLQIAGNSLQYPVSQLKSGMYYLRLSNGKKVVTKEIVVVH